MGSDLRIKKDATGVWEFILRDRSGRVDLSTASSVTLYVTDSAGALKIDGGSCTIVTPQTGDDLGKVRYAPVVANVDTAGVFNAEFKVTWSDGKNDKFPDDRYTIVRITDDLEP